jgi:hypothetical protein
MGTIQGANPPKEEEHEEEGLKAVYLVRGMENLSTLINRFNDPVIADGIVLLIHWNQRS